MDVGYDGAGGWGKTWTDNKMFKVEEEKKRQKKVVQNFLDQHPDYYHCPENDKLLVDLVEASFPDKKFEGILLVWAYKKLQEMGSLKEKPGSEAKPVIVEKEVAPIITGRRIKDDD